MALEGAWKSGVEVATVASESLNVVAHLRRSLVKWETLWRIYDMKSQQSAVAVESFIAQLSCWTTSDIRLHFNGY